VSNDKKRNDDLKPGELVAVNYDYDIEVATMCNCTTPPTRLLQPNAIMLYLGTVKCSCYDQLGLRWVADIFLTSNGIVAPHRVIDRALPRSHGQFKRWMKRVPK
jgi:hypothetical protein